MVNDPSINARVRKQLRRILASWYKMYKDDPSMKTAANLHKHSGSDANNVRQPDAQAIKDEELEAARRKNKEEARRKEKEEAERLKREREEKKKKRDSAAKLKPKRKPFNFEEVPQNALLRKSD
jgi:LAS seventeen-binding protein 5